MHVHTKRRRKLYSAQQMQDAIVAVKSGLPLNDAVHIFRVPKATLHDKLNRKYPEDATPGAQTKLTKDEEKRVVTFILYLSSVGFTITKQHILLAVQKYLTSLPTTDPSKKSPPSRNWYAGFVSRNPEISDAIYPNTTNLKPSMRDWFDRMHAVLRTEKEVFSDSQRVFLCDESTFFRSPKDDNHFVVLRDTNKAYKRTLSDKRESVTLLLCASACGQIPPPCLVYPACTKIPDMKNIMSNMAAKWSWNANEFGRLNGDILYEYMTKELYPWLLEHGTLFPIILFMDLQLCHIDLLLYEFCVEKQIFLLSLVQNMLHPIDTAVLRPFTHYCIKQMPEHAQNATFKVEDLAKAFDTYLQEGIDFILTKEIANEFRTCKLFPFGKHSVTKKYTRNKEAPLEINMDVDDPLKIEGGTLETEVDKNQVPVSGPIWQGNRSFSTFLGSQHVVSEPSSSSACDTLHNTSLQVVPLNPATTTYIVTDSGADIIEASGRPQVVSMISDNERLLEGETLRKDLEANEKEKVTYYVNKNGKAKALTVTPCSPPLAIKQRVENYTLYNRRKRVRDPETFPEEEAPVTVEGDEPRDPLEPLAVPGPSRICPSFDKTVQNKAHYGLREAEDFLSKNVSNETILQLSIETLDIKEEIEAEESTRLPENETLADIGFQDDILESDISSDVVKISHVRSNATESNSDSSVYFSTQTTQKPKQEVTTELLFHRYKIKSKREIDRLHRKIRELKASVEKYKKRVYRLQRRRGNVQSGN